MGGGSGRRGQQQGGGTDRHDMNVAKGLCHTQSSRAGRQGLGKLTAGLDLHLQTEGRCNGRAGADKN